ncbi:MAG: ABC transporter substrate-binding protein [Arthrobacter sp.]|nr:extracellular solute-binding protein [Micrococcaceae bacterium]MDN5811702.1 extracellular solute-binding protein [Micrococcaceae bacterium]MDN5879334.1 extracellular solute-binding protein [Micrococcaceae bacterium]MDN5885610.1 extracellular solute-binding protein [Micrococcaceae bacterium]MDN5904299.1 extracellular solute-binding protein [Micrococcaceae bacterium]
MGKTARYFRPTALLLGSALVFSVTGCGGPASSSSAEAQADDMTTSIDGQTLTYWSMWKEGEAQQKVIASAIKDFEKDTGAKVDVQWQGRSNTQKLVPALNTNNVPDLVDGAYGKLATSVGDTGQALGLGSTYDADVDGKTVSELIPEKYLKNADISDENDQPWMLPYNFSSEAFWFNKKDHPEIAANPPKTWDDFMATLKKLEKGKAAPLAADGDIGGYNSAWIINLVLRHGGPGSFKKLAADTSGEAWSSPEVLDSAKKVEEIAKSGYLISGYDASKFPAQQQKWATGKADLLLNGSWIPAETAPYASKGFDYASFQFPSVDGNPTSVRADFVGFSIPRKAEHAAAAEQLAVTLLDKKYQDQFGAKAKVLPIRTDATIAPEMQDIKDAVDETESINLAFDGVVFPGYQEKILWPNTDQLFLGKITAEEYVKKMQQDQKQYWKDNG